MKWDNITKIGARGKYFVLSKHGRSVLLEILISNHPTMAIVLYQSAGIIVLEHLKPLPRSRSPWNSSSVTLFFIDSRRSECVILATVHCTYSCTVFSESGAVVTCVLRTRPSAKEVVEVMGDGLHVLLLSSSRCKHRPRSHGKFLPIL